MAVFANLIKYPGYALNCYKFFKKFETIIGSGLGMT